MPRVAGVAVRSCAAGRRSGMWVAVVRPGGAQRAESVVDLAVWLRVWLIWLRVSPPGCW